MDSTNLGETHSRAPEPGVASRTQVAVARPTKSAEEEMITWLCTDTPN